MMKNLDGRLLRLVAVIAGLVFSASISAQAVLYDNGSMITHPGAGPGGTDISMASATVNFAGSSVFVLDGGPHFRLADDFTVPAGGWRLVAFITFAYETGSQSPGWSGGTFNLWDGPPDDVSSSIVLAMTDLAAVEFSGIYRTFNGVTDNTDRPVHAVTWALPSPIHLGPGTYWIDWQIAVDGSTFGPYVMELNDVDANSPDMVFNNGLQLTPSGWAATLESPGAELPFQVIGDTMPPPAAPVPAMGPMALVLMLALVAIFGLRGLLRRSG